MILRARDRLAIRLRHVPGSYRFSCFLIPQTWLEEAAGLCAGAGVSLGVHLNPIPYGNRNRSAGELSERLEYFRALKIEMLGIDLKECLFTYGSGGKIVLDRSAAIVVRDCLEKGFFLILQN